MKQNSNEFEAEKLQQIEDLAYVYMSLEEIQIITGTEPTDFISGTLEMMAFKRGRLRRKAKYHENILRLTDTLDSNGMAIEKKLQEQSQVNDLNICDY